MPIKGKKLALSLAVVLAGAISAPSMALDIVEGYKVKNMGTNLNVRYGPSTSHRILRTLAPNTKGIEILKTERRGRNVWARIRWDGKIGWVSKKYLESFVEYDKGAEYMVDISSGKLNVRYGPGTSNRVLRRYADGTSGIKITRVKKVGSTNWARISKAGKIGWVSAKYLTVAGDIADGDTDNGGDNSSDGSTYTVQAGDTLYKIMRETGKNWKDIAELNDIEAPYELSVGMVLNLPA